MGWNSAWAKLLGESPLEGERYGTTSLRNPRVGIQRQGVGCEFPADHRSFGLDGLCSDGPTFDVTMGLITPITSPSKALPTGPLSTSPETPT